jgi:hypothetical protein
MRNVPRAGGEYDKNRVHTGDECSCNGKKERTRIKEKMSELADKCCRRDERFRQGIDRGDEMKWDEIGRERLPDSLPDAGSIEEAMTRETGEWNADTREDREMKEDIQIVVNNPL